MHRTALLLGYVATCGLALAVQPIVRPVEVAPPPRRVIPQIPVPKDAQPLTRAIAVNKNLKVLCEDALAARPLETLPRQVSILNTQLDELELLDETIRNYTTGGGHERIREDAMRYRAAAWLNAWAAFGQLTERCARENARDERLALLGPETAASVHRLTRVYEQMRAAVPVVRELITARLRAEKDESRQKRFRTVLDGITADEPLRAYLTDEVRVPPILGYAHPWPKGERPEWSTHDFYIPARADLVGRSDDKPGPNDRRLPTLWSVVNRVLDTWRDPAQPPQTDRTTLTELMAALRKLGADGSGIAPTSVAAFDPADSTGPNSGSGFARSMRHLHLYLAVRNWCSDEDQLARLVLRLKEARNSRQPVATVTVGTNWAVMKDLIEAATPLRGHGNKDESLPQADVWIRYLLLLSYHGDGVEALIPSAGADPKAEKNGGIDWFWSTTGLKGSFTLTLSCWREPGNHPFVRWNQWPEGGHFVRAVADATAAVERLARAGARTAEFEDGRYRSLTDPAVREKYVSALADQVSAFTNLRARHLNPYFSDDVRSDPFAAPRPVAAKWAEGAPRAWSAWVALVPKAAQQSVGALSKRERDRLSGDIEAVAGQAAGTAFALERTLAAYRTSDPTAVAVSLQGFAGPAGTDRWDVNAMPTRTFDNYAAALDKTVEQLKSEAKTFDARRDLRDRFAAAQKQVEVYELELTAARLGSQIAQQGEAIAKIYREMAALQKQIADLNLKAEKFIKDAAGNTEKATELRLTLATQARDLAAAQVEALEQATAQAEKMLEQASHDLRATQQQLLSLADKIEESKKTSFLSILKAVVNVVGAALAPFTGGASLMVAQAVNTAISIGEKIAALDLNNLGKAVETIASIAADVGTVADISINKLGIGGPSAKAKLEEVKGWVEKAKTDINRAGGKAVEYFRKLETDLKRTELGVVFGAFASDIPISIDDKGRVKLDVGRAGIRLKGELNTALQKILASGGVLTTDPATRARVAKLLQMTGNPEYREELKRAVDDLIRVCPAIREKAEEAKREVEKTKADLKGLVDRLEADQQKLLGRLFGGWVLVTDENGDVVAVERNLSGEMAAFKKRVAAYTDEVRNGAIKALVDQIRAKNRDIEQLADKAAKNNDEVALRRVAREEVPVAVDELARKVEELRGKLELARGELKDAQTRAEEAELNRKAAEGMRAAAAVKVEGQELAVRQAMLGQTAATLSVRQAELEVEKRAVLVDAAVRKVDRSADELRSLYARCRRWGVNPLRRDDLVGRLALDAVLSVGTLGPDGAPDTAARERAYLDLMTENVIGMLQWVRLLNLGAPRGGSDKETFLLEQYTAVLRAHTGGGEFADRAKLLLSTADKLKKFFDANLSIPEDSLRTARREAIGPDEIRLIGSSTANEAQRALEDEAVLQSLPERSRSRALGYFRVRFTTERGADLRPDPRFVRVFAVNAAADYYAFLKKATLVRERPLGQPGVPVDSLRFEILPAPNGPPNPNLPLGVAGPLALPPFAEGKSIADTIQEDDWLGKIRAELGLWRKVELTPAPGEWVIVLLHNDDLTEAERSQRVAHLREQLAQQKNNTFTLYVPYLQVPPPVKAPSPAP